MTPTCPPSAIYDWDSEWPAPAKLNLFLHVVGRRPDGYHLLQTVFRFIDLHDRLRFSPRTDGAIVLATPTPGVAPADDLCVRAALRLQQATGCRQGVTIDLNKQLPMGGGLGGGSSDAATVLLALNQLWQTGLTRAELETLGLPLGADVPIFIHGRNAFAEGIGEQFTDLELPPATYLIVRPPASVPTAAIFGAPELRRDTPPMAADTWQPGCGHNDLEAVACARFPAVATALAQLRRIAPSALMTGSGACLFATFASRAAAEQAQAALGATAESWIASGLDKHPLAPLG
ncbi:4-(cytidine 5'-diphospho)-2-C-methyl-D-erythritol kinase [Dechloromonas sp. ZY10]|uniref:4-(cytidine 5'-diphospho)-2-C-methyl-D-erythritol kinase n=1 Tax=Dechloromonas aquae TaxID=2664436 RepID=UPI003527640D